MEIWKYGAKTVSFTLFSITLNRKHRLWDQFYIRQSSFWTKDWHKRWLPGQHPTLDEGMEETWDLISVVCTWQRHMYARKWKLTHSLAQKPLLHSGGKRKAKLAMPSVFFFFFFPKIKTTHTNTLITGSSFKTILTTKSDRDLLACTPTTPVP